MKTSMSKAIVSTFLLLLLIAIMVPLSVKAHEHSLYNGTTEQDIIVHEIIKYFEPSKKSGPITSYKVLADEVEHDFESRKKEINRQLASINPNLLVSYTTTPQPFSPYSSGELNSSYQNNALKTVNLIRYLSGLPALQLNPTYSLYAQHGAVLMKASAYGHYPEKPNDMSNSFYELGYKGTSEGNIYWGYNNLYDGIVHGWIADEDIRNIDDLGHRRWILNPKMKATGFGEYDKLAAMYAIDQSVAGPQYEAIAYPSGAAFPSHFFKGNYPWHISLNPSLFQTPNVDDITVTLSGGGKTFVFDKKSTNFDEPYFNVNTAAYAISNSIVFRPLGIERYIGTYTVQIVGLKSILGDDVRLSYRTTFYDESYVHPPEADAEVISEEEKPSDWASEAIATATTKGLVPISLLSNYTAPITRAEFAHLAVLMYESINEPIEPSIRFNDTTDINVRKIASLGIVNGTGNGSFNPHEILTREQAAKVLDLLIKSLNVTDSTEPYYVISYADQSHFSAWAKSHIEAISQLKIMSGTADNRFNPQGAFTREQSIMTMLRISELY